MRQRWRFGRAGVLRLLGAVLAGALVAGCGALLTDNSLPFEVPEDPSFPQPAGPVAAQLCPGGTARHLSEGETAVTKAYICVSDLQERRGQGVWNVRVVLEVTGGLDRLLETYAEPDATEAGDGECPAAFFSVQPVWLHGTSVRIVRPPWDGCGAPSYEGRDAYDALETKVVAQEPLVQTMPASEVDPGCAPYWSDALTVEARRPAAAPTGSPAPLAAEYGQVCEYRVSGKPTERPTGDLVSGAKLNATQIQALDAALAASTPDPTCRRDRHRSFLVLLPQNDERNETYVALDGCAVQQGSSWWRASDDLRALLSE